MGNNVKSEILMQEAFFVLPQTLQTRFDVEISLIFHIIGKLSRQENEMV